MCGDDSAETEKIPNYLVIFIIKFTSARAWKTTYNLANTHLTGSWKNDRLLHYQHVNLENKPVSKNKTRQTYKPAYDLKLCRKVALSF